MDYNLISDFYAFRRWFNKMFSLSLNGKFAGLGRLKDWKRFAYRLYKILSGRYYKRYSDILVIRMSGDTIKLYNR